jgi:hypothetical protein
MGYRFNPYYCSETGEAFYGVAEGELGGMQDNGLYWCNVTTTMDLLEYDDAFNIWNETYYDYISWVAPLILPEYGFTMFAVGGQVTNFGTSSNTISFSEGDYMISLTSWAIDMVNIEGDNDDMLIEEWFSYMTTLPVSINGGGRRGADDISLKAPLSMAFVLLGFVSLAALAYYARKRN